MFPRITSLPISDITSPNVLYEFGKVLREEGLDLIGKFVESPDHSRLWVIGDVVEMMMQAASVQPEKMGKTLEDLKDDSWYKEAAEEAWAKMEAGGEGLERSYGSFHPPCFERQLTDFS